MQITIVLVTIIGNKENTNPERERERERRPGLPSTRHAQCHETRQDWRESTLTSAVIALGVINSVFGFVGFNWRGGGTRDNIGDRLAVTWTSGHWPP